MPKGMNTGKSQLHAEGQTFGRLTVKELVRVSPSHAYYRCRCSCGGETISTLNNLRKGNTRSCGCLRSLLKYAPKTGLFYSRGKATRTVGKNGYQVISYKGKRVYAHRLAWFLVYGTPVPKGMDIDHINRDRLDNRIENLRVVTRAENLKNCKPKVNGLTGRELEVEELFKQGLTCTQIQEKLGIDRHLSARHLKSLGWKMKRGFAATKKRKGESQ